MDQNLTKIYKQPTFYTKQFGITNATRRGVVYGIYFDGRKDLTKVYKNNRISTEKNEHISVVQMAGSKYIGHMTVEKGDDLFACYISSSYHYEV